MSRLPAVVAAGRHALASYTSRAAKAGECVEAFRKAVVTDPKALFTVKAESTGERITLTGEFDQKLHNR